MRPDSILDSLKNRFRMWPLRANRPSVITPAVVEPKPRVEPPAEFRYHPPIIAGDFLIQQEVIELRLGKAIVEVRF